MTILGLDVGAKRVGVALANPPYVKAEPFETYDRGSKQAETAILALIQQHSVEIVVIGLPLSEEGEISEQCADIKRFSERLQKRANIKIEYVDEWGSSLEAKEALGLPEQADQRTRKTGIIDRLAASIILQKFLNSKGFSNRNDR